MKTSRVGRSIASTLAGLLVALAGCEQGNGAAPRTDPVAAGGAALTQDHVIPTGDVCGATGAHGKHGFTSCQTCHACGGVLQFDAGGPAVASGQPLPAFDAAAKTCSNVGCHAVPEGTYTYWSMSGEQVSVPYGGGSGAAGTTPSWYTTGAGACNGCHRLPASSYVWHSGLHGYAYQYATTNACQTCHPDATGFTDTSGVVTEAAIATTSTCGPQGNEPCAAFHGNGTVDVNPAWRSACFGCHM